MLYDVFYNDGEIVLSGVTLEVAQSYIDAHRFDCFSRHLVLKESDWEDLP